MSRLRFLTAGESHGPALVGILDGMPAGVRLLVEHIARDLQRRKLGYGRGGRMKIEPELPRILAGVRHGVTMGTPLAIFIENADHAKAWATRMAVEPSDERGNEVSLPRPGHADLTGAIKFGHRDLRNSLERASARETATRVALAAAVRRALDELDVRVGSFVTSIGEAHATEPPAGLRDLFDEDADALALEADKSSVRALSPRDDEAFRVQIERAQQERDTVGGTFEVRVTGLPPGVGTYAQHDLRLDGLLARALASIPAIKAVELGDGFRNAELFTNGEPLFVRGAMKPIATVPAALRSVDLSSGEADAAHVERSDTCAVPAAAVVGEAVVALAVAEELFAKLGGDSLAELQAALRLAWRRARLLEGHVYLCGLPGSGKSTVGPLLANLLGLPLIDLDARLEKSAGRSVPEIFSAEGEDGFRAREAAQVREISRGPRSVVALGGGAVTSRAIRHHVRRSGHLIWLRAPVDLCAGRAAAGRPLLAGDPVGKLAALASTREPLYARISDAQIDVEGLSPDQVARACAAAVRSLEAERAWR